MKPEIAVIGAGPAGVACAVQLSRFGYNPVLFEKEEIGGLVRNANCINNYPGFPNGISGMQFSKLLLKHIRNYNIKIIQKEVTKIEFTGLNFLIHTNEDKTKFDYLFISSGTKPVKPEGFPKKLRDSFNYDIINLNNKKNRKFVIVGAGDAAFDFALTLSEKNEIIILNRSKRINAIQELQNEVSKNNNINYLDNSVITDIKKEKSIYILQIIKNGKEHLELKCNNIILAIGREPNLEFLDNSILIRKEELIQNKKIYIIGDAANDKFRQISISTGSAIKSAMELHSFLTKFHY